MILTTSFILIILALAIYLNLRRPLWGLALVAFAWPFYIVRWSIFGLPTTLLEIFLLAAAIAFLLKKLFPAKLAPQNTTLKNPAPTAWRFPRPLWLLILWLAWSLLCAFVSPDWLSGLGLWRAYFLEPLIFIFLALNLIRHPQDWRLIWRAIGLGALLVAILAIIQKFTGWLVPFDYWFRGEGPRVTSLFGYPNAVGLFLAPLVAWFAGRAIFPRRPTPETSKISPISKFIQKPLVSRLIPALLALAGLLAVVWARSDGALLALAAGFLLAGLFFKKTHYWALAGILAAVLILTISNPVRTTVLHKFSSEEWSTKVRLFTWAETTNMLDHNWLLGAGLGGYQAAMQPFHQATALEIFLYPHNIILNFWSELGLPGLLLFLALLIVFFRQLCAPPVFPVKKSLARANSQQSSSSVFVQNIAVWRFPLLWAFLVLLIHGLVDVPYFKNDLAILFFWLWIQPQLIARLTSSLTTKNNSYEKL